MTFDYQAMTKNADELIQYFGMSAVLRRVTASPIDRPCTVALIEYGPRERPNELANPTDVRVVMSALDPETGRALTIPPDNEQDVLVIGDVILRMTCAPKQTAPAGLSIFWEFTVR